MSMHVRSAHCIASTTIVKRVNFEKAILVAHDPLFKNRRITFYVIAEKPIVTQFFSIP